jgi:threonine/homoserine/homoserine lactone efflux protein
MDAQLVAFVGLAAALAVSPGPDMALVLRNTLAGGWPAALGTIGGIVLGTMAWGVAAAIGIAAILTRSAELFAALQLAGAAYLAFLGIRAVLESRTVRGTAPDLAAGSSHAPIGWLTAFRQGLLTNLLNPKVGLFYTTLLPAFVRPIDDPFLRPLGLTAIHAGIGIVWLVLYSAAIVRAGDVLRGAGARRWLLRISGAVLVGLGLRVALERR